MGLLETKVMANVSTEPYGLYTHPKCPVGCLDGLTRSYLAQPSLHFQPAGRVLVGHPRGDASTAGLRAGAPVGAALYAQGHGWHQLVGEAVPHRAHRCIGPPPVPC